MNEHEERDYSEKDGVERRERQRCIRERPLVIEKHPCGFGSETPAPKSLHKFAVRPAGASVTSRPFFYVDAEGERCDDPGPNDDGESWNMKTASNKKWLEAIIDSGIQCALCQGLILSGVEAKLQTRQRCGLCECWLHTTCAHQCCDEHFCMTCAGKHSCYQTMNLDPPLLQAHVMIALGRQAVELFLFLSVRGVVAISHYLPISLMRVTRGVLLLQI